VTSGGEIFNNFSEKLYQPEKSQPKQRRLFFISTVAVGLFLEWAQCCSVNRTHLNPTLCRMMDGDDDAFAKLYDVPLFN